MTLTRDLVSVCDEVGKHCDKLSIFLFKPLTRDLLRDARGMSLKPYVNRLVMETQLECSAPTS